MPKPRSLDPRPWISESDRHILQSILKQRARFIRQRALEILEWGTGGSTVWFPNFLVAHGVSFRWLSVEHDRRFFDRRVEPFITNARFSASVTRLRRATNVESSLVKDTQVQCIVFDYGTLRPRSVQADRRRDLSAYVQAPKQVDRRFDVVLVDGRMRRRCLLEATGLLENGGIVLLHDAHREYYQCALAEFPHQQFIGDAFWIGARDLLGATSFTGG